MREFYICDSPENVERIFGYQGAVYSKDQVLSNPDYFKSAEIIFSTWGMPHFTEEEIKNVFPALKAVFYGAGTVQSFAREFLNCGVRVFSAWAANAVPVAEFTLAEILLANKGFFSSEFNYKDERDIKRKYLANYPGNYSVKIGIIGAGMIGKLVIKLLKNHNFDILVFDPFLPDEKALELGIKKCSLETLFSECQVVSNHLADNEQTRGMLDKTHFEKMQPFSVFINTGRGAQVVEKDLIDVLKMRPDITALLDVTYPEPPENDSELYTLENCVLTPHIAGSTGNEVMRMGEYIKAEYQNFIQNEPCEYEVTSKMLETMA